MNTCQCTCGSWSVQCSLDGRYRHQIRRFLIFGRPACRSTIRQLCQRRGIATGDFDQLVDHGDPYRLSAAIFTQRPAPESHVGATRNTVERAG